MRVHPRSLSKTLESVEEAQFESASSTAAERFEVARFIARRQGLPGSYAEMFAGFTRERNEVQLFTGERITSASARHILGEEACRSLRLLNVSDKDVRTALERADASMRTRLKPPVNGGVGCGWFCCGKCSVGVWRNLLSGGLDHADERLADGVALLNRTRDGRRGWHRFPFWYTVLALAEMKTCAADEELKYVAASLKRTARVTTPMGVHARHRQILATRVLQRL